MCTLTAAMDAVLITGALPISSWSELWGRPEEAGHPELVLGISGGCDGGHESGHKQEASWREGSDKLQGAATWV